MLREIEERRARRALSDRPIDAEVVERVMRAATLAPSCFNNQPWRYVVVRESGALSRVKEGLSRGNYWASPSPMIVAAVTQAGLDCTLSDGRDYAFFDLGLATANLMLQATSEGLYAHPIAGFKPEEIRTALGVPPEFTILTLVILGYPGDESELSEDHRASEHAGRSRKPAEEVISHDGWRSEG